MINEKLVRKLIEKHLTISFVESFSGGLAAKKIVDMEYDDDREAKGLGGFMESLLSFVSKK